MGKSSDSKAPTHEASMADNKDTNMDANTSNEHPSDPSPERLNTTPSRSSSPPEVRPTNTSETEDVAKDAFSGSSIFQGLSHLLHTCLVLGALDARERFLGASATTQGDTDNIDATSKLSGRHLSSGELKSSAIDTTGGVTIQNLSGESQDDYAKSIPEKSHDEDTSDDDTSHEEHGSDIHTPHLSNLQHSSETSDNPDCPLTQHSAIYRGPSSLHPSTPSPQQTPLSTAPQTTNNNNTHPHPLFHSFSKPSPPSPPSPSSATNTINFADLPNNHPTSPTHYPSPSTTVPLSPPPTPLQTHFASVPAIQSVKAARKPMIVP
ncbi:MAG: hypothetical protein Q9216_006082, partial [Gyalolechia sp. 2 TL-2023]